MALATIFTMTLPNGAIAATIAHGLYHGGASRTPHFFVAMANQGNTGVSLGALTVTWDSTSFVLGNGAGVAVPIQIFLKRCHTIEDAGTF